MFVIEYPKDRHQLVVTTFLHLMKDYIELEKPKMERAEQLKKQGEKPDMFEVRQAIPDVSQADTSDPRFPRFEDWMVRV